MSQFLRNNNFVFIPGQNGQSPMRHTQTPPPQEAAIDRPVLRAGVKSVPKVSEAPVEEIPVTEEEQEIIEEQLVSRSELEKELESLKQAYITEGEKIREEARVWSESLTQTTQDDIRKLYEMSASECKEAKMKAEEEGYKAGYDRGFSEGDEKGYEEGYNKGLRKCKDTLKELLDALSFIDGERDRFFKEHENRLFDAIFTIANKIVVDSLKQKDKAIIQKMLKEAAKGFRNSEFVKVTLSKLDIDKIGSANMDVLKEAFRENQHIEFEIVKDAPEGTLILDNGSEITDAGVATQLMMIEKLGKGKFRNKDDDVKDTTNS